MEKITLTATSLNTFMRCSRLYFYRYILGYKPIEVAHSLKFGQIWHKMHEDHLNGKQLQLSNDSDLDEKISYAMMGSYLDHWSESQLDIIECEQEHYLPLVNYDTLDESTEFVLGGKLDSIVSDSSGRFFIFERKTSSENLDAGSVYWERLIMDVQFSMYCMLTGISQGIYDVV